VNYVQIDTDPNYYLSNAIYSIGQNINSL